jgi:hypothetical protein
MSVRTERDQVTGSGRGLLHADDEMKARVARWRRQRMNWAAIARNLGRSEPDVRRAFAESCSEA